jgi:hypothetical protein
VLNTILANATPDRDADLTALVLQILQDHIDLLERKL